MLLFARTQTAAREPIFMHADIHIHHNILPQHVNTPPPSDASSRSRQPATSHHRQMQAAAAVRSNRHASHHNQPRNQPPCAWSVRSHRSRQRSATRDQQQQPAIRSATVSHRQPYATSHRQTVRYKQGKQPPSDASRCNQPPSDATSHHQMQPATVRCTIVAG